MMHATILDYLTWRGDLQFQERPLNEVDNLIFSKLIYFDFPKAPLTLQEAYVPSDRPVSDHSPLPLLEACAQSERYASVFVTDFTALLDTKTQFAAAAFHLNDGSIYVAFRGTDDTIIGWREDFNLCYMEQTPAQGEAVKYLEKIFQTYQKPMVVGGHSKGGNLAAYAAAFCSPACQRRIKLVYSNDGPGFNQIISSQPGYRKILPKIQLLLPESSVIGIIFSEDIDKVIIRCTVDNGAQQHNPYTWLVEKDHFLRAENRSVSSLIIDETLNNWMDSLDMEQRENFVSAIFDALEASGAATLTEINANKRISYNAILKAAAKLSPELKSSFFHAVKKLALASRNALWDETKRHFEDSEASD